MKTITQTIVLLIALPFMTGCSGEEDSGSQQSILGKWNFDKIGYTADGTPIPEVDYYSNQQGCPKNYIRFNEGGVANSGQYSTDCVLAESNGPWLQTGTTFELDTESAGVPTTWKIKSVTDSELKISGDMTGLEGVEPDMTIFMNLTLQRAD